MSRISGMVRQADHYLDVGSMEGNVRDRIERSLDQARTKSQRIERESSEIARTLEDIAARFETADGQSHQNVSRLLAQNVTQIPPGALPYSAIAGTTMLGIGTLAGDRNYSAYPPEYVPTAPDGFGIHSNDLLALTREQKVWPERRGRPRNHHPTAKVSVWEDELWEAENPGHTTWGGLRFGGESHASLGAAQAGIKGEWDDGMTIGPYASVTAVAIGASGVIGSKDAGLAGGVGAKALEAEAFIGVRDASVGAKIGGKLVSAEATVGGNVAGTYVGVVGGIGVEFELGLQIGKKTRIDLGPFTLGLDIGEALGA